MSVATISDNKNTKLGPLIHGWAIPAGRVFSCPGESVVCKGRCYAKSGFFRMPNVLAAHARNLTFSRTAEFTAWMTAVLRANHVRVMRVHVAGDFYDIDYIQKWVEIVKSVPDTQFFAYTRSWRVEEMLPALIKLGAQPNFALWWSSDLATGPAPLIRGIRRAYMAISDADAQNAPDDCDLVFRDQTGTVMKKTNGIQVCPPENGIVTQTKITCSKCGICWKNHATKWEASLLQNFQSGDINVPGDLCEKSRNRTKRLTTSLTR